MSNFNQYFRNQGAKIMVERFFSDIDAYNPKQKLTDLKWHIAEEATQPASYYIENGLTATHKVVLEYTINYDDNVRFSEFEVPKEIDGAFIIEGAYRIATNTLGNDYDCRINMSGTGRWYINFDYDRQYDIAKKTLKVRRTNPELGLAERVREYPLEEIDKISGLEREALRLTDRQIKKLQIKLNLDYKPEFITQKLIEECIAFGDDRVRDLIIDKKIESVPSGFMDYLFNGANKKNFYGTRKKIQFYWGRYGKLQEPESGGIKVLTMLCARFWKGSSDASKNSSNIQVSPGINAINMESYTTKIQVPQSVAINQSMLDLIDVGDTPINQNVNKQNSLTLATHITDEDVLYDCYTKDFERVTISYLDYLNSKVVASEYVDYEKNEVKPNPDGQVEVKYRLGRKMVSLEDADFIDLHPDWRLSTATRRIPFVNYTDSVRIHMGSSMLKQSIPLVNAERPLVDTGNIEELKNNTLNEKFTYDEGTVKEITEDKVIIELPNKDTVDIPRRSAIQSVNDVAVYTEPKVKVGDKVKQGDVITGAVGLEKDTYKAGLNALVLFHAMFGHVNEDALVVSESFAKKMCSYSIIDLTFDVKTIEAIKWLAPIGTKVKAKDPVMTVYRAVRLDEINRQLQEKLGGIFGEGRDFSEYTTEESLRVPNNIDEAVVSDILIQENKKPKINKGMRMPDLSFSHTSRSLINEFESGKQEARKNEIYSRYPEYIAADTLDPVSLQDLSYKVVYKVRVRLIKRTNLMVGSKVTNRYGGKGVISKVLPDNEMPVMVESGTGKKKVVEVVMNPYSTINRKIPSVNMEQLLSTCAVRIHDLVDEWKSSKTNQKKIMPMLQRYYPGRFDSMTLEEVIEKHNNSKLEDMYYFNVGSFSTKFTPQLVDQWASELGVTPQSKVLIPTKTVADLKELKGILSEKEYEEAVKDMEGKYTEIDKPLSVGQMHLIELYHIPTYSNKVTSSLFGVDINEWKDSPIMGRGEYRTTGQKIGEMELTALLARNVKEFIEGARGDTAEIDNQQFLNHLLGLGLTVTDSKGYNQGGSSLKGRLGDMKVKFRLKNQK